MNTFELETVISTITELETVPNNFYITSHNKDYDFFEEIIVIRGVVYNLNDVDITGADSKAMYAISIPNVFIV